MYVTGMPPAAPEPTPDTVPVFHTPRAVLADNIDDNGICQRLRHSSLAIHARDGEMLLRKEVIQPHLPVRLPCYDLVLITDPTFDGSLHKG